MAIASKLTEIDAEEELVDLLMNEPNFQGAFVGGPPLLKVDDVEDMFKNTDAWKDEITKMLKERSSR